MSAEDSALQWFRADAKRLGLSIRAYEREMGLTLMPAQYRIAAHDSPESALADGWERHIVGVVGGNTPRADEAVVMSLDSRGHYTRVGTVDSDGHWTHETTAPDGAVVVALGEDAA